ncbi:MAG: Crp/Fnr family transcriptional regulator [Mangrovibacterium sp.]
MIEYDHKLAAQLFSGMNEAEINELKLTLDYTMKTYQDGELLVKEGEPLDLAYFVHRGAVQTSFEVFGGREVKVNVLESPSAIAQDSIFAQDALYPVSARAIGMVDVMIIKHSELLKGFQMNPKLLANYLLFVSNRHKALNSRMRVLLIKTIPQKLAFYILDLVKDDSNHIVIPMTQTDLAEYLAVTRPSLARGLRQLAELKLIKYRIRRIEILNKSGLAELLDDKNKGDY